ncbi:MAG: hypothetical protein RL509_2388 [Pseudomonadota bacterium]|jgi:hypothetical protein
MIERNKLPIACHQDLVVMVDKVVIFDPAEIGFQ